MRKEKSRSCDRKIGIGAAHKCRIHLHHELAIVDVHGANLLRMFAARPIAQTRCSVSYFVCLRLHLRREMVSDSISAAPVIASDGGKPRSRPRFLQFPPDFSEKLSSADF
ncbi:unnamed protein product [Vicia faba]|uniref:Uncharacterized protein n=1 Tax=Vicia faba TaxID=3906 RepID=A0AAV1B827_VICFA|nr:unnamed protein product [Vicia faba]